MSLRAFHCFFIILSVAFLAYLGIWATQEYQEGAAMGVLLLAAIGYLGALGLAIYLPWFIRKSKGLSLLGLPCAVCLTDPNSPMTHAANAGTLFLLAVVGAMLFCFASLFGLWIYRAKRV